jgi:4-hydroxybenzoate polyprenyltransferase
MNADTKRFLQTQMMWIAISLAISLSLSFLLPFPLSLVTIIGVFLVMNYYIRRWQMRRMGMMGSSSTSAGGGFGGLFGAGSGGGGGVSYVCMVCGQRFKSGTCPRCGSKMKRADF